MAYYSYKYAREVIPKNYIEGDVFLKNHGYATNHGANYDGDYWLSAGDYIRDLRKELQDCYKLIKKTTRPNTYGKIKEKLDLLEVFK